MGIIGQQYIQEHMKGSCNYSNIVIKVVATIFSVAALVLSVSSLYFQSRTTIYIGISTTLATLAGAILVFSTLQLQQKALQEEKRENESSRFDSRFYPILSSFRMDAANMEISREYISPKGRDLGRETIKPFHKDVAFFIARQIIETLLNGINDESLREYDSNELQYELQMLREKEYALDEYMAGMEELDEIEKEMKKCVHSYQGSYLLYKYGITKKAMEKYKRMDSDSLKSLLLRILMDHQPTILAKYIQSLRFMIHIIEGLPNDFDKKDYYLHISCLTGRQEQLFLSCFKEFEVVTNNEY